jgi:rod shape-determining protein MreB
MAKSIGIDLGTSNTLVYVKGKGLVLREPSVVAVETRTKKVVAVGHEAQLMLGKTPGSISAMRPLHSGVIADFDFTSAMLHSFFKKVSGSTLLSRPKVIVCIPYGVTEVEKRAVEDVTLEAGAQSVALIEEPMAAAIGSGLRVEDARGSMVVDIGGGTTEVAIISLGGIVLSTSLRIAGEDLDESIVNYIKKKYNILIGNVSAEAMKIKIGSAYPGADHGSMEVSGHNLMNGLPAILTMTSAEVREAMHEDIVHFIDTVRTALENTPPELSSDIYDNGIMLTGGGALITGFSALLQHLTGIKTIVAKAPLDCVATGIGKVLESNNDSSDIVQFRYR